MAAVTQKIPNLLGGVSTQPDEVKLPGQVREIINGFADPAVGLLKRQGTKLVAELKDTSSNFISPSSAITNGKWFSIFRDDSEKYIGVIQNGAIRIWDAITGAAKTVNYESGTTSYLSSTGDYDVLSIYDQTFIANKAKVVAKQADPTGVVTDRNATIVLKSVEYSAKYTVTINSSTYNLTTRNADDNLGPADPAKEIISASQILDDLKTGIEALGISNLTVTKYDNSLELVRTGAGFTISAKGGQAGDAIEAFQFIVKSGGTGVSTLAKLPEKSVNGRLVKITNFGGGEDDFYVKYIAADGVWEETISPFASPGLDATTMPHVLVRESNGTFTFKKVDYEPRLVGDDVTNDHPSFVGRTIDSLFFHANRFGVLSGESVVMSQSADYFNFYAQSALTQVASDPIDINVSSIVPTRLHSVLPVTQGLVLFSANQQFMLSAVDDIFSPSTVSVNTIASYENVSGLRPVDMGVSIAFISKTDSFSRVFEMQTRGSKENPVVAEISNVVSEWIPAEIDSLKTSAQNSLLAITSKTSPYVYTLRYYTENQERQIEAWIKWKMLGDVIHLDFYQDIVYIVTKQTSGYWFQTINLVTSPSNPQITTADGIAVDPRIDMWTTPTSITYDPVTQLSTVLLPFRGQSTLDAVVLVTNSTDPDDPNQGTTFEPTLQISGSDYFYEIPGDWSTSDLIVGYKYEFEVEFPRLYFRDGNTTDFTAALTISRIYFNAGLSGDVGFKLIARGRSDWTDINVTSSSNYYLASTVPLVEGYSFMVPIHQRNQNYTLKVLSDTPYPVSLISMTWEGMYSPRYYRRA
jgi:hypothetical protein